MKKYLGILLIGILGGIIGAIIFTASPLQAALKKAQFQTVDIFNPQGKRVGTFSTAEADQGVLFLFSENNKTTIQMGSYPSGSERGQALIGMNDPFNQLRLLFRLHGSDNSPTMVMKDRYGVDKIVMGLKGDAQTPYLEYTGSDGITRNLMK